MASREVKVGAFVLLGLLTAGAVVFLIGDERSLFKKKTVFETAFTDVEGLKRGSPVRMGGIDIGTVGNIDYARDANDSQLHVNLDINEVHAARIREGSVVSIEAKGLLGDKMVVITVGDPNKPALAPGSVVPSTSEGGLSKLMGRAESISTKADQVMTNLERTTQTFAEEDFRRDLRSTLSSINTILQKLERGDGYVGKLLGDSGEADRLSRAVGALETTGHSLDKTLRGVNQVLDRVNTGPGFAHDVVYGDQGSRTMSQFGMAAEEVALSLRGVREGNGAAHALLYGGEGGNAQMMADLGAMTHDLRMIVADIRAGKGTLGAFLVDPSVYEDVKVLLGNVERNKALRALVRYSIRRDEPADDKK